MKQLEELESTNAEKVELRKETEVMEGIRDLGSEREDTLRCISLGVQVGATQPPV